MNIRIFPIITMLTFFAAQGVSQLSVDELNARVKATDVRTLPYKVEDIVVRGFDGDFPPPRLETPMRNMFYGYGMTAYIQTHDTLIFFNIERLIARHKDPQGKVLLESVETGGRYTDAFKRYFTEVLDKAEWKNIYFEDIYLKDKKGNYIKVTRTMKLCPLCK